MGHHTLIEIILSAQTILENTSHRVVDPHPSIRCFDENLQDGIATTSWDLMYAIPITQRGVVLHTVFVIVGPCARLL